MIARQRVRLYDEIIFLRVKCGGKVGQRFIKIRIFSSSECRNIDDVFLPRLIIFPGLIMICFCIKLWICREYLAALFLYVFLILKKLHTRERKDFDDRWIDVESLSEVVDVAFACTKHVRVAVMHLHEMGDPGRRPFRLIEYAVAEFLHRAHRMPHLDHEQRLPVPEDARSYAV